MFVCVLPALGAGMDIPTLETDRLVLRRPLLEDVEDVDRIHCKREIAEGVLTIPHPYPPGEGAARLKRWEEAYNEDRAMGWLIMWRETGEAIGFVGCGFVTEHKRGTLGYVIDPPFWGRGIATEATRAAIRAIFEGSDLMKIEAGHWVDNPASGRVLEKCGFRHEGLMRQHYYRLGRFRDMHQFGLLRSDYESANGGADAGEAYPRLVTRRLILRGPEERDIEAVRRVLADERTSRLATSAVAESPGIAASRFFADAHRGVRDGSRLSFVIEYKSTGDVVGVVSARVEVDLDRAEACLVVDPSFWNLGIGTEAMRRFTAWILMDRSINRLYASHAAENVACAGVLRKAGFIQEGVLRQHDRSSIGAVDAVMWSLLREEYMIGRDGLHD